LTSGYDQAPAWSPDGKQVAFSRARTGVRGTDIVIANARNRVLRKLPLLSRTNLSPAWSPDGREIAFEQRVFNSSGIDIVDSQTGERRVTIGGPEMWSYTGSPSWSPDGSRLAFYHQRDVFTAKTDGSDRQLIARGAFDPAWSPDGNRIAYVRFDRSGGSVVVANADGTGAHALTSSPRQESEPAWSPDGTRLAFVRSSGKENRKKSWIVIAKSDTGKPLAAITSAHSLVSPAWRAPATLPRALPKNCR
jgi:TolB protein